MKALRMILLFVVCTAMAACGGENLDVYKDKVLEAAAKELKTTKELLVKDLDIKIDSMSLLYFYVEDSIAITQKEFEEILAKKEKLIKYYRESIEKDEEAIKNAGNDFFSGATIYAKRSFISEAKQNIKSTEKEIQKETDLYNQKLEKFKSRDKKELLFHVLVYRVSMKNPLTGMHNSGKSMALFTPDGETYLKDANKRIREHLSTRETK